MKRIIIDADDRIVEALQRLCSALVADRVSEATSFDMGALAQLFDGKEKEIAWQVID